MLLLTGAVLDTRWRAGEQRSLQALLRDSGLERRRPELVRAVLAEPDPVRGRLAVARALVNEALDMSGFQNLPPREAAEEAARVGERLELAEQLAVAAARQRPAAWQSPMLVGAARYLNWARRGDPRLITERPAWEDPLLRAVAAAPREVEPLRLLGATRLELWPVLNGADRDAAREVLRRAFEDETTSRLFLPTWLRVAGSTEQALAILPNRSETWEVVARTLASARDWSAYIEIYRHKERLRRREIEAQAKEIGERLQGGDTATARRLAAGVIGGAPLDAEGAALVTRVVGLLPPAALSSGRAGEAWVRWAGQRAVRGQQGLPNSVVARLLGWAGEVPDAELALARLVAGDLAGAELLERRSEDTNREVWGPYFIAKARWLQAMGDTAGARQSLAQVHRGVRKRAAYLHAAVGVAEHQRGDAFAVARSALEQAAAERWPGNAWEWSGGRAELEIELGRAVSGLGLTFDLAPPAGAVAAVKVDDFPAELVLVRAGGLVELRRTLLPGLHVVAVSTLSAGRVAPGEVRIIP
jgi:hypothetical protein